MTTAAAAQRLPVDAGGPGATGAWGMILLIVTEASLFVYLLFSYFYLGSMARGSWPPSGPPELRLALPNTIILLVSSTTMWWADAGIRAGRQGRLRLGLLVTLALGVVFLAIQLAEYRGKQFTPHTNAYGSLFYTITGFHMAHVAVGLIMILVISVRGGLGHFSERRHLAVTNVTWYWHFVDVVWLAVFTSLYLSPRFL
ncbi:MAG: cytochrome c oxidase subunit 3 [Gemmatimonadales bacterium]